MLSDKEIFLGNVNSILDDYMNERDDFVRRQLISEMYDLFHDNMDIVKQLDQLHIWKIVGNNIETSTDDECCDFFSAFKRLLINAHENGYPEIDSWYNHFVHLQYGANNMSDEVEIFLRITNGVISKYMNSDNIGCREMYISELYNVLCSNTGIIEEIDGTFFSRLDNNVITISEEYEERYFFNVIEEILDIAENNGFEEIGEWFERFGELWDMEDDDEFRLPATEYIAGAPMCAPAA